MVVDGRDIAADIEREVRAGIQKLDKPLTLAVIVINPDLATKKFIEIKKKVAEAVGVHVVITPVKEGADTQTLCEAISSHAPASDGIIVQLPLLPGIDVQKVLNAIPKTHDVDVVSEPAFESFVRGSFPILPPVVGAMWEILGRHSVPPEGKRVVVVGEGRLVGKPAAVWFRQQGSEVISFSARSAALFDVSNKTKEADIIVLGAGSPNLLKLDMIKEGIVILDAGTSEAGGKLVGDADPACAEKAALFTPVPGGIGPITVSMIFKNLLSLSTIA